MESAQVNGHKMLSAKKGLSHLGDLLHNLRVTTKQNKKRQSTGTNMRKEKSEKHITENHQTDMTDRNTRKKRQ